ncbi:MAG TPA: Ig-like domain-containing protein, partial [Polyangiaceae bacterium]|nr:Ig-like domain-containing protein [Polyangiaceae bacterium]
MARSLLGLVGVLLASAGCSVLLDFESNRKDEPALAELRAYRFVRGEGPLSVATNDGLLGPGPDRIPARSLPTERGGTVAVSADGSFSYAPPGPTGSFWGDDTFQLALREDAPSELTGVRITIDP